MRKLLQIGYEIVDELENKMKQTDEEYFDSTDKEIKKFGGYFEEGLIFRLKKIAEIIEIDPDFKNRILSFESSLSGSR